MFPQRYSTTNDNFDSRLSNRSTPKKLQSHNEINDKRVSIDVIYSELLSLKDETNNSFNKTNTKRELVEAEVCQVKTDINVLNKQHEASKATVSDIEKRLSGLEIMMTIYKDLRDNYETLKVKVNDLSNEVTVLKNMKAESMNSFENVIQSNITESFKEIKISLGENMNVLNKMFSDNYSQNSNLLNQFTQQLTLTAKGEVEDKNEDSIKEIMKIENEVSKSIPESGLKSKGDCSDKVINSTPINTNNAQGTKVVNKNTDSIQKSSPFDIKETVISQNNQVSDLNSLFTKSPQKETAKEKTSIFSKLNTAVPPPSDKPLFGLFPTKTSEPAGPLPVSTQSTNLIFGTKSDKDKPTTSQLSGSTNTDNTSTNLFGDKSSSKNPPKTVFGTKPNLFAANTNTEKSQTNLFGANANPQKPQTNLFGTNANPEKPQTNLFGANANPQKPQANLFGANTNPQKPQTNLFGTNANPEKPQTNLFGANANPQKPQVNLFGANASPQKPQTNLFGPNANQQKPQSNLFAANTETTSTNLFANKANPQKPQTTLFGSNTNSDKPTSNLFVASVETTPSNLFGNKANPQKPQTNLFGTNTETTPTNLFGTKANVDKSDNKTTIPSSIFGATSDTPSFSFATSADNAGFGTTQEVNWKAGSKLFSNTTPSRKTENNEDANEQSVEEEEHDPHFQPIIDLPPLVQIATDEDSHDILFKGRCKLYRFMNNEWKERGVGEMKVLQTKKEIDSSRPVKLLMRRDQVRKICCNQRVANNFPSFAAMPNNAKSVCWIGNDYSEGAATQEKFAIRFLDKNADLLTEFKDVISKIQESLCSEENHD